MELTRHRRQAFGRLCRKLGTVTDYIRAADSPAFFKTWLASILLRNELSKPQIQILPLKHIRLQQLADAGHNVPIFRYWLRGELIVTELEDFRNQHGSISLRNVTEERLHDQTPKLPVEYDKDDLDFIVDYCSYHNRLYHTLVNKAYPLRDSKLSGNIILLDDSRYVVSYFEGYGTPRDVDDKSHSELRVYLCSPRAKAPGWAPKIVEELVMNLRATHLDFSPIIPKTFEFSVYPYPVGTLNRPEILWEWRSGSAHDLYTIVTRLLERADSHELIFQISPQSSNPLGMR